MKFGSLFAGIGGFDFGLEKVGMTPTWQVEIDSYATRVLEKHWPNVTRYSDIRQVGKHNLEAVDLVCGGFPCQPHSLAGKRAASADERDLWGEFARIIRELKPRWVVAENVPGLLTSESGRFFGRVLRDLAEGGYDCEWQCLPASAFGAPHRRDRVWIVANSNSERQQEQRRPQPIMSQQFKLERSDWWEVEPDICRVVDGFSGRVDRLKCLGNAVVPQVVEWIGKRILKNDFRN